MSKSFSRSVRHAGLISALVMAPCLAITAGVVSAETIKAQLATRTQCSPSHHTNPARHRRGQPGSERVGWSAERR